VDELTDKQAEALEVVRKMTRRRGFPPTLHEMAAEMGLSVNAVRARIDALVRKNRLRKSPRTARGITVMR
jgi:repressor LexA